MKTRHFEFDADDHLPQHVDAEALQREFDDEQADYAQQREDTGVWARWALPLAILFGIIFWTVVADHAIDWISANWLTETR